MPKHLAKPKNKRGIGVEHASLEAIRECLMTVQEEMEATEPEIEARDLIEAGLIGGPLAKQRRERLGEILNIGYTNGKQLQSGCKCFRSKRVII